MKVQLSGGKLRGATPEDARSTMLRATKEVGSATKTETITLPPYYSRGSVILEDWAANSDSVRLTDKHGGGDVERLEKEALMETTLIVFMTDHGISHARDKQFLYDEGTHVPLVIRGPGVPKGDVREDLVESNIDLPALSLAAA